MPKHPTMIDAVAKAMTPQGTRRQDPKYGDWSGVRRSMTYGVLPTRAELHAAFQQEVQGAGHDDYEIRNVHGEEAAIIGDTDANLDEDELWVLLKKCVRRFERGSDAAGDLASAILSTLGFEWV